MCHRMELTIAIATFRERVACAERHDLNDIRVNKKINGNRKTSQQCSSHVRLDFRELKRDLPDPAEGLIDFGKEFIAKTRLLMLIHRLALRRSACALGSIRIANVTLLDPNSDCGEVRCAPRHSCAIPRRNLHALGDGASIQIDATQALKSCSHPPNQVPERLHIADLLFRREIVESRRRHWNGSRHSYALSIATHS